MSGGALIEDAEGFTLRVRLTPGADADRVEGPGEDSAGARYLAVRVRARPEKGAANAALETTLARALGAPKSAVRVARGAKARLKSVRVAETGAALARARNLLNPERRETA